MYMYKCTCMHACMQLCAVPVVGHVAVVVVYIAAALNWMLVGRFLYLVASRRSPPEPYWAPGTVSVCTIAVVGPTVGAPRGKMQDSRYTILTKFSTTKIQDTRYQVPGTRYKIQIHVLNLVGGTVNASTP